MFYVHARLISDIYLQFTADADPGQTGIVCKSLTLTYGTDRAYLVYPLHDCNLEYTFDIFSSSKSLLFE